MISGTSLSIELTCGILIFSICSASILSEKGDSSGRTIRLLGLRIPGFIAPAFLPSSLGIGLLGICFLRSSLETLHLPSLYLSFSYTHLDCALVWAFLFSHSWLLRRASYYGAVEWESE